MTLYYIPQKKTTTLSTIGGIDASQTTGITLTSVSNVDISAPGIVCLTWSNPISDSLYEYVSYTSISGSNELVGVTRGAENSTGRTHSNGATVAWVYSASHINNINDLLTGVTGGALLKNEKKNIITTAGGTTAYTLTPSPAITAYATGQEFVIKMNATNTGASTINISGLGAKSLTKGGATALASGDLLIDAVYKIVYDGTQFQVVNIPSYRIVSAASYTTDTGTSLSVATADEFIITAQAGALLFNAPGGSPVEGTKLIIRIKDNGTARALTWNSVFRAMGTALPTTTVLSKTLYLGFIYNFTDTKWDLVASAQEA